MRPGTFSVLKTGRFRDPLLNAIDALLRHDAREVHPRHVSAKHENVLQPKDEVECSRYKISADLPPKMKSSIAIWMTFLALVI
jgi:hypothetical protein